MGTQHLTFVCSHTTVHWGQPYLWSWSCHCWRKIRNLKEGMIKGVESTKEHRKSLLVASRRNLTQTNLAGRKYLLSHLMRESEVGAKHLQRLHERCHLPLLPSVSLLLLRLPFSMSHLAWIVSVGCPQSFLPESGILQRMQKRSARQLQLQAYAGLTFWAWRKWRAYLVNTQSKNKNKNQIKTKQKQNKYTIQPGDRLIIVQSLWPEGWGILNDQIWATCMHSRVQFSTMCTHTKILWLAAGAEPPLRNGGEVGSKRDVRNERLLTKHKMKRILPR